MSPHVAVAPAGAPHHGGAGTIITSPHRRDHLPQPPVLTTSLSGLQYQGGALLTAGPTPSSALSSPFSHANPSPFSSYTPSPGGTQRGSSPMAARQSGAYSMAYNPQEWGPVNASPQIGSGAFSQVHQHGRPLSQQQHSDDPAAPPPYSPRRRDQIPRLEPSNVSSPADTTSPGQSQYNTPTSAVPTLSAEIDHVARQARSRPASMIYSAESMIPPWSSALPPPPPGSRAGRSSSSTALGRTEGPAPLPSIVNHGNQSTLPRAASSTEPAQRDLDGTAHHPGQNNGAEPVMVPPSSKRAVSASAIGPGGVASRTNSTSGSRSPTRQTNWEPGMPLPGPPPGPPPSASRSQSANGVSDRFGRHILPTAPRPKTRQAPHIGTSLGPVPPTPAGWIDMASQETDSATESARTGSPITFSPVEIMTSATPSSSHSDVASTFFRPNPKRDSSAKGIRERRSESRSARDNTADVVNEMAPSSNPWADSLANVTPVDLTLPAGGTGLGRRRTITKSTPKTPRSSRSSTVEDPLSSATHGDSQMNSAAESSRTTPRPDSGRPFLLNEGSIHTPPFSPGKSPYSPQPTRADMPPKALPTPPLQHAKPPMSLTIPSSNLQIRPISHILHMPNETTTGITAPLSPRRPVSARSDAARASPWDHDSFVRDCLDRTRAFLEKEHGAEKEEDKLRLFSEYILAESRIRRRRYATAFKSFDARQTRDRLFELNMHAPRRSSGLQETTIASPIGPPSPHPFRDPFPARIDPTRPDHGRPDSMWWTGYQPALSPIASMSMNDEESSRGRAPSRWWESQTGSESGGGTRRVERSKRESKYMGLPLHEAHQAWEGDDLTEPGSSRTTHGANEYPPEKVGWHEPEPSTTPSLPPRLPSPRIAVDVSRLVTLPPPYPRHYPAVQNQHPDLLSYRTLVRTVSNLTELSSRRQRYKASVEALRKDSQARVAESRKNFRVNIQAQIEQGSLTYAEAAEAEAAMKSDEHAAEKSRVQAEFDSFQDVVLNPLHDLLNDRIAKTSHHISDLRSKLLDDAQLHNPNSTQTAGDERPELLEQLTQLKWLFEAREQLHREVFHLLTERNEKYQAIVTLPYQQSGNKEDKIRETAAFFARDTQERTIEFENQVLKRHTDFLSVIEANVLRGAEAQLSAFWDIAPGLLAICQKIPEQNPYTSTAVSDLFIDWPGIQIPREEMEENPSYGDFPMQYLYSLLVHAERSTYQFIESQVNLLCLLHEARTGVMAARVKCWEVAQLGRQTVAVGGAGRRSGGRNSIVNQASSSSSSSGGVVPPTATAVAVDPEDGPETGDRDDGEQPAPSPLLHQKEILRETAQRRRTEEIALTAELKDRVATVEGQWTEALGSAIVGTRERVKAWLVEGGGWDKELLEDGVE